MTRPVELESAPVGALPTLFAHALGAPRVGSERELGGDEAAHLRALRARVSQTIAITDGRGARWRAELTEIDRRSARVRLLESLPAPPLHPVDLRVPVGNRERSLWLVEKAVELGVASIGWIEWDRSRSVADAGRSEAFLAKAERRAVAALTQSGGAWLPALERPVPLDEVLKDAPKPGERRWLADARGSSALEAVTDLESDGGRVVVLIGPEGGVTQIERDRCTKAGYRPVRLGARTLRFETAAIAFAAIVVAAREGRG